MGLLQLPGVPARCLTPEPWPQSSLKCGVCVALAALVSGVCSFDSCATGCAGFRCGLEVMESLDGVTVSQLQGLLSGSSQALSSST